MLLPDKPADIGSDPVVLDPAVEFVALEILLCLRVNARLDIVALVEFV